MTPGPELSTDRLVLRRWSDLDREPYALLNIDERVIEYLGGPLSRTATDAMIDVFEEEFRKRGFGLWAVELRSEGRFVGFVGLHVPSFDAHFTPAVEIGWRLAWSAWGNGFATEGAMAALGFAFDELGLDAVVSMTTPSNARSQGVMQRIGMHCDPADDFEHPRFAIGDPLRHHVLYRIDADAWKSLTMRP